MNKIVAVILGSLFLATSSFSENRLCKACLNQISALSAVPMEVLRSGVEFCEKEGYTYFKIKELNYSDYRGNTMVISGVSLEDDYFVFESRGIEYIYSLYCYTKKPLDGDAINVESWVEYFSEVSH